MTLRKVITAIVCLFLTNLFGQSHLMNSSEGSGGTITPLGSFLVNQGEDKTYIIAPDNLHNTSSVIVDRSQISAVTSYRFLNVEEPHTIYDKYI